MKFRRERRRKLLKRKTTLRRIVGREDLEKGELKEEGMEMYEKEKVMKVGKEN